MDPSVLHRSDMVLNGGLVGRIIITEGGMIVGIWRDPKLRPGFRKPRVVESHSEWERKGATRC